MEPAVNIKLNSVNFICDWKYDCVHKNTVCPFCTYNALMPYHGITSRKFQKNGIVRSKCNHIAHLACYLRINKTSLKNKKPIRCYNCARENRKIGVDYNVEGCNNVKGCNNVEGCNNVKGGENENDDDKGDENDENDENLFVFVFDKNLEVPQSSKIYKY